MPKVKYIEKKFYGESRKRIETATQIIAEYEAQGFVLTLRQLYYQFVARGLMANKQSEYKKLGSVLNDARLAGLIDWHAMEDRTRNLKELGTWGSVKSILRSCANSFRLDMWENQPNYIEVWIEKDALIGVIEAVCNKYRVPFFACRGYNSQSEQWNAGQRLAEKARGGQKVHVLHLGDHDPSGMNMTVDNRGRLSMFMGRNARDFKLHRLGLNIDQVRKYNPPPNPNKETDSRTAAYKEKYGPSSWELDALEPKVIAALIEKNILKLRDKKVWDEDIERENKSLARLNTLAKKEKA